MAVVTWMFYFRYLLKDQLKGPSSVEGFVRTLKKGCRYIERKFADYCFDDEMARLELLLITASRNRLLMLIRLAFSTAHVSVNRDVHREKQLSASNCLLICNTVLMLMLQLQQQQQQPYFGGLEHI